MIFYLSLKLCFRLLNVMKCLLRKSGKRRLQKCVYVSIKDVRFCCPVLMKIGKFRQAYVKPFNNRKLHYLDPLSLKMDAISSSATSVTIYQTTHCVISEDLNLYQLFCENVEFSILNIKVHENQFGYSQVVSYLRRVRIIQYALRTRK